jgi:hypothetical protein
MDGGPMMVKRHERELAPSQFIEPPPRPTPTGQSQIAVLIPGIRTNAEWIDQAAREMDTFADPIRLLKAYGGPISTIQLITRLGLSSIRNEIRCQIFQIILDNPLTEISLICHSIGTDVIVDILRDNRFHFKYIFFMGAICSRTSAPIIARSCRFFINHRGTFDPWPIMASFIRPCRYDATGTYGFGAGGYVNDRRFNNNHKTCTDSQHIYDYVIKLLQGMQPEYPTRIKVPFDYNLIHYLRNAIYLCVVAGIAGACLYTMYSLLLPFAVITGSLWFFLRKRNANCFPS